MGPCYILKIESKELQTKMILHCPQIEPETQEWESWMLPLHQQCWLDKQGPICYILKIESKGLQTKMMLHCPGVEPKAQKWESWMLPLHQCQSMPRAQAQAHTLAATCLCMQTRAS